MIRLAMALACGLVGAGIVHIVTVLSAPALAERTAFDRVGELGGEGAFAPFPQPDPHLEARVCRFPLERPVRIAGEGAVPFWSASVLSREGTNLYSLNDRTATGGTLDLVVARRDDLTALREGLGQQATELVPVNADAAMVIVRSFVPDETRSAEAGRFLSTLSCEAFEPSGS